MPTRRLMTKGLFNARDLGGFPTKDGRTTKFGVFVRSEAPVELPEEDIAYLRCYGITASMDFRSTGECVARPSDLREILPYYHRPLFHEAAMAAAQPQPLENISWGAQYISMAEESRDWAVDVLTIAAENPGALLYHCTTGKDRTGLMTCYLLAIAGWNGRTLRQTTVSASFFWSRSMKKCGLEPCGWGPSWRERQYRECCRSWTRAFSKRRPRLC